MARRNERIDLDVTQEGGERPCARCRRPTIQRARIENALFSVCRDHCNEEVLEQLYAELSTRG